MKKRTAEAEPPVALTVAEAIEYSGISRTTLYRYRKAGVGPNYIVRGTRTILYLKSELDRWHREGEATVPDREETGEEAVSWD
jgi:predicted DNA-binding transcriptional regulator AlpA